MKPLRFYWSLSSAGQNLRGAQSRSAQSGVPNRQELLEFCQRAEECAIESLLTAFGFHRPDPIGFATALGTVTEKIKLMVAVRSGVFSPTVFVQQVNTVSAFLHGRICINVVAGHTPSEQRFYGDFWDHDERYQRTDEFLTVCRSFWRGHSEVQFEGEHYRIENGRLNTPFVSNDGAAPEIFIGGNSPLAELVAIHHGDCLWRMPDTPEKLRPQACSLAAKGVEVGLLVSIISRPTHDEGIEAARSMITGLGERPRQTHKGSARRSDSVAFTSNVAHGGDRTDRMAHSLFVDGRSALSRSSGCCSVDDAREFLAGQNIDVDAIAPQVDGKIMSAFVRALKPRGN